jgi:hypothetical protein
MHIIQFTDPHYGRCLGVVQQERVENLTLRDLSVTSTYIAFRKARSAGQRLVEFLQQLLSLPAGAASLPLADLLAAGKVLAPLTEEPGSRLLVSGTGLTHLGSMQQRDQMHKVAEPAGPPSDSRKMFELGLKGGKPESGQRGTAPEWFYKGDGRSVRGPGQPLEIPAFAPDGGEEPEIAGLYIIDAAGIPCRLGFTQGNEWSDHVTENQNYLYLAPSKLRTCSIGPELVTDLVFEDVRGSCRVYRGETLLYHAQELCTGERHMSHSLANIEDHHFKYLAHRQPGDIHVHFFGTSKLSFPQRTWTYQTGDQIEVSFEGLGAPLRNPVLREKPATSPVRVEIA